LYLATERGTRGMATSFGSIDGNFKCGVRGTVCFGSAKVFSLGTDGNCGAAPKSAEIGLLEKVYDKLVFDYDSEI